MIYADQEIDVRILSLRQPGGSGMTDPLVGHGQQAHVTLLSPVEIPLGASFALANAGERPFQASALGCVRKPSGHFVVLGSIRA